DYSFSPYTQSWCKSNGAADSRGMPAHHTHSHSTHTLHHTHSLTQHTLYHTPQTPHTHTHTHTPTHTHTHTYSNSYPPKQRRLSGALRASDKIQEEHGGRERERVLETTG